MADTYSASVAISKLLSLFKKFLGSGPAWVLQVGQTGTPTLASDGVDLQDAVKTLLQIRLREEVHRKTARITIGEADVVDTTYRVTIDANNVDTAGDTDQATTLQAIVDAINADATVKEIVMASLSDDRIVITGDAEADYTLAVSVTLGTGTIAITHEDASAASARIFLLPDGTGDKPAVWTESDEGVFEAIGYRGKTQRLTTAGYSRMYVEIFDADGDAGVSIGPGGLE